MTYACGQCGSRSLYQDRDAWETDVQIVCMMCGNRWPGTGIKPKKIEEEGSVARAECRNCGRNMCIAADHLCGTCFREAMNAVPGAGREAALAEAKRRIEAGELRPGGKNGGRTKKADQAPVSPGKVQVSPGKVQEAWERVDPVSVALTPSVAPMPSPEQTIIPIVLKLSVEIDIRVKSQVG